MNSIAILARARQSFDRFDALLESQPTPALARRHWLASCARFDAIQSVQYLIA